MKTCRICNQVLDESNFYDNYATCKICMSTADKQSRIKFKRRYATNIVNHGFKALPNVDTKHLSAALTVIHDTYGADEVVLNSILNIVTETCLDQLSLRLTYTDRSYTIDSAKSSGRLRESLVELTEEQSVCLNTILDDNETNVDDFEDFAIAPLFDLGDIISDNLGILSEDGKTITGKKYTVLRSLHKAIVWASV